jgi:transcriptional regulator with XRE-family HTH domain
MPRSTVNPTLDRIAKAVPEARQEYGLSRRQFAAMSGVSTTTIRKLERGGRIDPALLVRLATTTLALDAYGPPWFLSDVDELLVTAASTGPAF